MTGKRETDAPWHQTTVVLRSDIYQRALERGIDISDACNRALAGLTDSEYPTRQPDVVPPPPPVIIAKNGTSPHTHGEMKKGPAQKLHPVINADDPAAPAKVVEAKIRPVKKASAEPPASLPVPAPVPSQEQPVAAPAASTKKTAVPKGKGITAKKRSRGDALKTFFSSKIARTDETETTVSKDEVYELFARFCRERHITPVPERKAVTVALKNQFALTEKLVDGTPCWTGIRLK